MKPIVNGIRYCGVIHGNGSPVYAAIRLERHARKREWEALSYLRLGTFPTRALAKSAVIGFLHAKRNLSRESERRAK